MRIYIDTSVVGGVFDEEFRESSESFFAKVTAGEFVIVVSRLLRDELVLAPEQVRDYLDGFHGRMIEEVRASEEALDLADLYVAEKVVGATSLADCQHIATATVHRVDVLVSWNFKHIVNLKRIRGYNSVNLKHGYPMLEIRTPTEVLDL
ncbi:MAG TPA: hypothetical protein VK612_00130 [Pyrinomonadaceae bacterium]|nr:hypothetical protein [Pyrinomonadaceae bacterium]